MKSVSSPSTLYNTVWLSPQFILDVDNNAAITIKIKK